MIYVTGDTHGDEKFFAERGLSHLKKDDVLIITGDFGFIWDNSKEESKKLNKLMKRKHPILFVEGAHENFELLSQYEEVDLYEGKAKKIAENIYCLNRGELYLIEGRVVFALGGGLAPEADENSDNPSMPTDEELEYAVVNLQEQHMDVDLIITHEAPASVKRQLDRGAYINDLTIFLDTVLRKAHFGKWFFGSLHQDRAVSQDLICVFEDAYTIE